jgi:1-acyl-sn-glycerol-3-phosphate acyltransferase
MPKDPRSKSSAASGDPQRQSSLALFSKRRFAPLFLTQCCGAFNDTLLGTALFVLLAGGSGSAPASASPGLLAAATLAFPVIAASAIAGQLGDSYDKTRIAQLAKALEMAILAIVALGVLAPGLNLLLGALVLLGVRSALFDPVKYAILAQQLRADELVGGNALLTAGTAVAMLGGALAGGLLTEAGDCWAAAAMVAATGLLTSLVIPPASACGARMRVALNPIAATWRNVGLARLTRAAVPALFGMAWVWCCGALVLARLLVHSRDGLLSTSAALILPAIFVLGIGAGAMLCTKLSGRRLELGLLPCAAIGQALFTLDLAFALPGAPLALASLLGALPSWRVMVDLGGLGVFCGLFIVPLKALIQSRSAPSQRSRILSVGSLLEALALLVAAALTLPGAAPALPWLLAGASIGFFGMAAYAYFQEPHLSLRFLTDLLIHSFYRVERTGFEHIPETGAAVLVCNHVSFVDSIVLMAAVRRPIRFVMDHRIHRTPVAGLLFRHSRTIPIATAKEDPLLKEAAFAEVACALQNGELIGLFPEGGITRTGELMSFRYGVGRIVSETPVPVIPMALRGLWGSFFSRRYGPAMSRPSLLRLRARIEVVVGEPVVAEKASPEYLHGVVARLRGDPA